MTDQNATPTQPTRVFKIGATRIVEDPSMSDSTNEQVRDLLKTTYPEIANATIRERTDENGLQIVEFLPQPGRKG
jgi:PRTRC genetic system protein C